MRSSNTDQSFNEKKFAELVVYIATRCQSFELFGATKLNKILFYSDFEMYRDSGRAITGAKYVAHQFGPVPDRMASVRDSLIKDKAVAVFNRNPQSNFRQDRLVPLRNPDLAAFDPEEISLVDNVIGTLKNETASFVTELSHGFLGWQAAWKESEARQEASVPSLATGDVGIPYETVFVSNRSFDQFETQMILDIADKDDWNYSRHT